MGEEGTQGGENRNGKGKCSKDGQERGNGKATENVKGKGKGNGKGKGFLKPRLGGDDITHAIALKLQQEMYEADSDREC
jgi:hypothetical protein